MNSITLHQSTKSIILSAPLPEDTKTYKGVTHRQIIDLTMEGLSEAGFIIKEEIYKSARDGRQARAQYNLNYGNDSEMGLMVGWHNSYDRSMSLKFAIGAHIYICANGSVRGDIGAFKRKHMGQIQTFTPATIKYYLEQAEKNYKQLQEDRDRMKERHISRTIQAELVGRMFIQEELINTTQLGIIKREIDAPTHDYNASGSLWELYNYTTYALKEAHPTAWLQKHIETHEFFMENV